MAKISEYPDGDPTAEGYFLMEVEEPDGPRTVRVAKSSLGEQGPIGPQGPQGADGSSGGVGNTGPQGPPGEPGANGSNGADGADGTDGADGADGDAGPQGAVGNQGPAGQDSFLEVAYAATINLDFTADNFKATSLTGNLTFTTSNRTAARSIAFLLRADGSNRTLTFEAWTWLHSVPTHINANKQGILSLSCFGTAISDIFASYAEQP